MRRWNVVVAMVAVLCGTGCAMEVEVEEEDVDDVGLAESAITNGYTLTEEEYSGVLALQYLSPVVNGWASICTATLMTNQHAITAAHCLDPDPDGRQMYAKMGSQRIAVIGERLHPDFDVAVIKLATPMRMWNWNGNGYLTSPRKVTTSGYGRPAYSRTNDSLDGASMLCLGYGGASESQGQPPLTFAILPSKFDGDPRWDEVRTYRNRLGQLQEPGDSGGPCLAGMDNIGSPLAFVLSGCFYGLKLCYGAGAESWALWAYYQLITL